MTKADIILEIGKKTGVNNMDIQVILDAFFETVRHSLEIGETIYLRKFGTFYAKKKAPKIARDIRKNTSIFLDEHFAPDFKPSKSFVDRIKSSEDLKKLLIK
ncbi:MAG: integration host factor subunit beta [Bacteroidetes bacterium]|nr:integration host factor subunit beta [Bacteroidota bacterium]